MKPFLKSMQARDPILYIYLCKCLIEDGYTDFPLVALITMSVDDRLPWEEKMIHHVLDLFDELFNYPRSSHKFMELSKLESLLMLDFLELNIKGDK